MDSERPLFAQVGRVERTPTDNRARLFQLFIALGLLGALVAFLAEISVRTVRTTIVEVDMHATPTE